MATADPSALPVVLVHGWGGSFAETWERSGFTALLEDAGRPVIGIDLLGHGNAPKPHDLDAYADLTTRIEDAFPANGQVDAIGFSLGAITLLRLAMRRPERFHRLVLAGIGRNLFDTDDTGHKAIVAALEGTGDASDNHVRMFVNYADMPGNDRVALTMVMKRPAAEPFTEENLAKVTCPVLVAIGDKDFAGPGDPLVEKLPDATLQVLRNVDHFATPETFAFIDAALEFIGAVPT